PHGAQPARPHREGRDDGQAQDHRRRPPRRRGARLHEPDAEGHLPLRGRQDGRCEAPGRHPPRPRHPARGAFLTMVAEPLTRQKATRTERDWTARTRDTALNALRYSRFVMVMKRVLPILAGPLIPAVIAYSLVPRQSDKLRLATQNVGEINNDLT